MRDQHLQAIIDKLDEQFPDYDHTAIRLVVELSNTYHILASVMERAFAKYKITPQSMDVLTLLYMKRGQECALGEIGELLLVSPANVTGLVQGLVRKGLVGRREDPQDRRKRLAEITPRGIALMEDFLPKCARFLQDVFAAVSPEDKRRLCAHLRQIADLLMPYWEKRILPELEGAVTRRASGRIILVERQR